MSGTIVLGVDLGTLGMKVIAVEAESAQVLAAVGAPIENLTPAPGQLEQEPEAWWLSLCRLTRTLLSERDIPAAAVAAIGLSGHMHSIVPLRPDGTVARNCIVWADTRSQPQADRIAETNRPLWNPAIAPYSLAKILWLREHEPTVYNEIDKLLFTKDYLRFRLTGEIGTDYSDASGSLMWDFSTRDWDGALLAELGISRSLLPPAQGSGEAAGKLTPAAARDLGLGPGVIVAHGGGDAACAVVGSGLPDRDTLMINAGTAVQVIDMQDAPRRYDPSRGVRYLFELGLEGRTFAIGALNSAGHSLDWWRKLLDPAMSYAAFNALAAAEATAPEDPLFLPYLQGTGTPYLLDGPYGSFVQLSATADKAALTRAVLDGVAFGIKHCAEALVGEAGLAAKSILFTGGVPKNPLMRAILAGVFGGEIRYRDFSDMSALGAAAHGATAAGLAGDAGSWLADFDYGAGSQAASSTLIDQYAATYTRYKMWAARIAAL